VAEPSGDTALLCECQVVTDNAMNKVFVFLCVRSIDCCLSFT